MDGPKAFPGPSYTKSGHSNGHEMGMTLRDYFASHAPEVPHWFRIKDDDAYPSAKDCQLDHLIKWRWFYADAMLKARESDQ